MIFDEFPKDKQLWDLFYVDNANADGKLDQL